MRPVGFTMLSLSYTVKLKFVFFKTKNIYFVIIVRKVITVKNLCFNVLKNFTEKIDSYGL